MVATAAAAHDNLAVKYKVSNRDTDAGNIRTTEMTLVADNEKSLYYNTMSLYVDSCMSTPEGDWRALAIYQIMVGSFVHSDKGAEGYDNMWGPEGERKDGNLRDGGLKSAFDFDGKQLISGAMDGSDNGGLDNGWDDVMRIYSSPAIPARSPSTTATNLKPYS